MASRWASPARTSAPPRSWPEGLGIALLQAIESDDPTALIGLPLIRTAQLLRAAGLTLP